MALESLTLAGLALNDGVNYSVRSLQYTPAQTKPVWATNQAADGDALFDESHYTPAYFELLLQVRPQTSTDNALKKNGELLDRLQSAERTDGGVALEWKPGSTTYTSYVLSAELLEVPTENSGDLQGWLLKAPVVKVKLVCRSFLYTAERTAKASTESAAEPIQIIYVPSILGDVPAEARLILTDKATQNRRFAEVGWDAVSAEGADLLLSAADLTVTGFSGSSTTRTGAFSEEKVKRTTAVGDWSVMCGTGVIAPVGSYRIEGRFYTASADVRVRISYRAGDGSLTTLEAQAPPAIENFSQVDLGEVFFPAKVLGTQKGEIRVEVRTVGAVAEVDLNYLLLYPTSGGYGRARGLASPAPNKLIAYDSFALATEGNLDTPKALELGGNWAEATEVGAAGFKIIAASDLARRVETKDTNLLAGCWATAGTNEPVTAKVSVTTVSTLSITSAENWYRGCFLRYTAPGTNLLAILAYHTIAGYNKTALLIGKSGTLIAKEQVPNSYQTGQTVISLAVSAEGVWKAWAYPSGTTTEPPPLLEGYDPDLAEGSGKAIAKGKGGMYDAYTGEAAATRDFDAFSILEGETASRVCFSGKGAELRSDGFIRQDSTGTYYGTPSEFRGANLYLAPAGAEANINRLVIGMRRADVATEADPAVTDKHTAEVKVRERFLAPR